MSTAWAEIREINYSVIKSTRTGNDNVFTYTLDITASAIMIGSCGKDKVDSDTNGSVDGHGESRLGISSYNSCAEDSNTTFQPRRGTENRSVILRNPVEAFW